MTWQTEALDTCSRWGRFDRYAGKIFHVDGSSFSTNGMRLLVVDGEHGKPSDEQCPPYQSMIVDGESSKRVSLVDLVKALAVEPKWVKKCPCCDGTEEKPSSIDCDTCRGRGVCWHCDQTCPDCDGDGEETCDDHRLELKRINKKEDFRRLVDDLWIDAWLVYEVLQLLPADVVDVHWGGALDQVLFRGDGWVFIAMPLRWEGKQPAILDGLDGHAAVEVKS